MLASVLAAFIFVFVAGGAWANTIQNGDFSTGTFEGWTTSGNFSIQTVASASQTYKDKWDLTPWGGAMDGYFAMVQSDKPGGQFLFPSVNLTGPSKPISFSFDYAVASVAPPNPPHPYEAYFYLQVHAKTPELWYPPVLAYKEIAWTNSGVFTGKVELPESYFGNRAPYYTEFSVDFNFFNPYGFDYLVGIDNVDFQVSPVNPVPEPATFILFASGIVGLAVVRKKKILGSPDAGMSAGPF